MNRSDPTSSCPGCGAVLPVTAAAPTERFNASAECWARYCELSAYTLSLSDPWFLHQLAVDAYAAQHPGPPTKPITTTFALVGLCLACEHGLSGRGVQRAHQALGTRKRDWPHFTPPDGPGAINVTHMLDAAPGAPRDAALRAWSESVWATWRGEHARVRSLVEQWLPGRPERFDRKGK